MIQLLLISYLLHPLVLVLISFFTRRKKIKKVPTKETKQYRFGIIVTAHRDLTLVPPIIDSLLRQSYPHFHVYVVADDCAGLELPQFADPRVQILSPSTALNTNTRSIEFALDHFDPQDEVLVIFDPDNLVHPAFLETLNHYYNQGFLAVQGNLLPKNTMNLYEKIDALGMSFYSFIDREMRARLRLSANIWGCGVSVMKEIYLKVHYGNKSLKGGFDKHMQTSIVKMVPRIAYAAAAIVYDEKVSTRSTLEKQRIRWIGSYFNFVNEGFNVLFTGIRRMNFNLAYFGYNLIRPPYFLIILMAIFFTIIDTVFHLPLTLSWIFSFFGFVLSLVLIVLIKKDRMAGLGLIYTPIFFFNQFRSLWHLKEGRDSILKTQNYKALYIKDVCSHEHT